ncbi:MAG: hypothetical protein FWE24_09755 [Defluviitaleaceae bacterium]|nr:hypothetical protein [Defluviitaleaceae bacterium]
MSAQGYIIRLFKRLVPIEGIEIESHFDYLTFMNFDSIKIEPVTALEGYRNISKLDAEERRRVLSNTRQKILLYRLEKSVDIKIHEKDTDKPFTVFAILDIHRNATYKRDMLSIQEYIQASVKELNFSDQDFSFELFGTLCTSDYVIAMKSNSIWNAMEVLYKLRTLQFSLKKDGKIETYKLVRCTYAITCFDYNGIDKLKDEKNREIGLSIRLGLSKNYESGKVIKKIKDELRKSLNDKGEALSNKDKAAIDELEIDVHYIFGKFDIDLYIKITSKEIMQALMGLFISGGYLNPKKEEFQEDIYETNTQFFIKYSGDRSGAGYSENQNLSLDLGDYIDDNKEIDKADFLAGVENIIIDIDSMENLPDTLKSSVIKLLIRAYHVAYSYEKFSENIHSIIYFADVVYNGLINEEAALFGIASLNTFLDNQMASSRMDFEVPQSNIRFTRASAKVLISYSIFIRKLYNAFNEGRNKTSYAYVTADIANNPTAHKIVGTSYLEEDEEFIQDLWNYTIPFDDIHNPYLICYVLHEIGHGIRFCERHIRNNFYRGDAIVYTIPLVYKEIVDKHMTLNEFSIGHLLDGLNLEIGKFMCNHKYCKALEEKGCLYRDPKKCPLYLNEYKKVILKFIKAKIQDNRHSGQGTYYRAINDNYNEFIEHYEAWLNELKMFYQDAAADTFMVEMLGITKPEEYIRIFDEYIRNNKKDWNIAPALRIMAVLLMLNKDDNVNMQEVIENLIEGLEEGDAKDFLQKEFGGSEVNPLPILMADFLRENVQAPIRTKIEQLKEEYEGLNLQDFLSEMYKNILKDESRVFKANIDFIKYFYYNS